ncbi:MAG: thioredoxin [Lachnospiraceae bacterium]|nr:thioredoxin [Lachnospiraceae bacterium]
MAMKITSANFNEVVKESKVPVLIDFWADWCGPCKMFAPVFDEVAAELEGKAVVGKINVDEEPDLARAYRVMSIPTLVVVKDGEVVKRNVGALSKKDAVGMVETFL